MIDVFISYSSEEMEVAKKICTLLENDGIHCWMAPRDIPIGSHWAGSIAQALRNAKVMAVLFSKNSNKSAQVLREVTLASNNKMAIIPIKIDDSIPNNEMEYFLSISHWLDVSNRPVESAIAELGTSIRSINLSNPPKQLAHSNPMADPMGGSILDIYDENMAITGSASRADAHLKGLWHKTIHCWFISRERDSPYVWMQRRSNQKAYFPQLFDITTAWHLNIRETDHESFIKSGKELGVQVDFEDAIYLGVRQYAEKHGAFYNREFNTVYLYNSPYVFEDYHLQPEETSGIIKISAEEGMDLFSGKEAEIAAEACLIENGKKRICEISITSDDIVPRVDDYYRKIFSTAKNYFSGTGPLAI